MRKRQRWKKESQMYKIMTRGEEKEEAGIGGETRMDRIMSQDKREVRVEYGKEVDRERLKTGSSR